MRRVSPTWSDVLQNPRTRERAGTHTQAKHKYHVLEDYGPCISVCNKLQSFTTSLNFWRNYLLYWSICLSLWRHGLYIYIYIYARKVQCHINQYSTINKKKENEHSTEQNNNVSALREKKDFVRTTHGLFKCNIATLRYCFQKVLENTEDPLSCEGWCLCKMFDWA